MNFQSDVHSAVEVVKGWEIVQKTSIFSEEFDERTFKYEFLPWPSNNSSRKNFSKVEKCQKSDFFKILG